MTKEPDQLIPRSAIIHKVFEKNALLSLKLWFAQENNVLHFSHRQLMDLAEFINKRYQHILPQCLSTLHFNALCQQFYLTLLHFPLLSLSMMAFTDTSLKYNLLQLIYLPG